ncbi:MAG: ankyrin repeat domain-containing protein, partial [Planctomycetes bacterium]|nr:ankyrin repeat domain-containing protein [Planctomycetota bacterium]
MGSHVAPSTLLCRRRVPSGLVLSILLGWMYVFAPGCVDDDEGMSQTEGKTSSQTGVDMTPRANGDRASNRPKVASESLQASDITEIRELTKEGADVDVRNEDGATSLHVASQYNRAEVVKLLLEANVDVNARNKNDATALYVASRYDSAEVVK